MSIQTYILAGMFSMVMSATPTTAQQEAAGRVADSVVGEIGQRQSRVQSAINTKPMERINNRVRNRVDLRIRNRIDRFYNPQGDAASSFDLANDRSRINASVRSR